MKMGASDGEYEDVMQCYVDKEIDGEEFADSIENRRGVAHEMAMMGEWRRIKNRKHNKERKQRRREAKLKVSYLNK